MVRIASVFSLDSEQESKKAHKCWTIPSITCTLCDGDVVIQWVKCSFLTCMWLWLSLLNHTKVNYLELLFYCALKSEVLNWPPFPSCLFEPRLPVLPIRYINRHPFKWRFKSLCCPPRPVDLCHRKTLAKLICLTANVFAQSHAAKSL